MVTRLATLTSLAALATMAALGGAACERAERPTPGETGDTVARPQPLQPDPRPAERTMTVRIEGFDETLRVVLYRAPDGFPLPFSTYVPEDMAAEEVSSGEGDAIAFVADFAGQRNEAAAVRLIVAPEGVSGEALAEMIRTMATAMGSTLTDASERLFGWADREYRIEPQPGRMDGVTGIVAVGRRDGRTFALASHYPPEYGDGFSPRAALILDEWRWTDTGQGLQ